MPAMKFKMAENSLFAILLRSRWWVSFAVGAIWALLAAALVPQPYKIVAILGSLPFWALGFVAFIRQVDLPSNAEQEQLLNRAANQNWNDFAASLERAWKAEGYAVERANQPHHDFVLRRNGKTTVAFAKRWKAINHGVEPLRQLLQAQHQQQADECAYISIVSLAETAQGFADQHHIALVNSSTLAGLLKKAGQ